jgi:ribulose-phosphate 3-epimerase
MQNPIIAPSLLAADFSQLQKEFAMINESQAEWLHLDVMDGVFVPNISFFTPVLQAVQRYVKKKLDMHLMMVEPEKFIKRCFYLGASSVTIHYEACNHLHENLYYIRREGGRAGVAINPHTPVDVLEDVIQMVDLVCVMSVNPGFGGQAFIENTYHKVERLKEMILRKRSNALIQVDGGVQLQHVRKLVESGADVLVAGTSVFGEEDPLHAIRQMRDVAIKASLAMHNVR